VASVRFPILFTGASTAMVALGITRSGSYVEVGEAEVEVRMSWAFRARFHRDAVRSVADDHDPVWGWGAHGWRRRWLVNGSSSNIVRIDLDQAATGRVLVFPVRPLVLRVSVEDPDGLRAALGSAVP
jgi:hypothetical protein